MHSLWGCILKGLTEVSTFTSAVNSLVITVCDLDQGDIKEKGTTRTTYAVGT